MLASEKIVLPSESARKKLAEILAGRLKNYTMVLEEGSKKGDNYIGILYRCIATKRCSTRSDETPPDTFSVIIKLAPHNEVRRQHFFTEPCFVRETLFYEELYPMIRDFQRTKGVAVGFQEVPDCYGAIKVKREEALFLEDLKVPGFQMLDRHEIGKITIKQVEKIMEVLAKFHAVSYAMKDQESNKVKRFIEMPDIFLQRQNDVGMISFTDHAVKRAIGTLDAGNAADQPIIKRLTKQFAAGYFAVLKECVTSDEYSTICHGDCWNNNILFKQSDEGEVEVKLLDFQMMRYASPATDIWYFLMVCTTKKFRDEHFENLIRNYYDTLSTMVERFGSDPAKVYPREVLDAHIKKYATFGMLMAILLMPLFTAQSADAPDLQELANKLQLNENTADIHDQLTTAEALYSSRMSELLRDMAEKGYL